MSITSILIGLTSILVLALGKSISVPPLCFEPFNGLDCGGSPLHVLYYYKSGSRCEVAIWRGCPTQNKFQDEYECINTCIFTERARPEEHHNFGNEDDYQLEYVEGKKTIDEPAATTISADSGYEADNEGGAIGADEAITKEADGEKTAADDENAANAENANNAENADGENPDDGEIAAGVDNENAAHEVNKHASEGDEETKIEATSEGTLEIGSEDIGAN